MPELKNTERNDTEAALQESHPTVGIVGLGVMGGSFASRLHQLGFRVIGFDQDEQVLSYALEHDMIDQGAASPEKLLPECDLVIFCLYTAKIAAWIEEEHDHFKKGALLLEISGVKSSVADELQKAAGKDLALVSVHPMCGRESRGIQFASPNIFKGSNFIIIDYGNSDQTRMEQARKLAELMEFGKISVLSPEEHDRMIGFLSQLTHVIAVCLMNTHENSHLVEYTGDSFRDLTRIARINESMWPELFLLNKEILLEEITAFEEAVDHFKKALEEDDREEMSRLMVQSTKRRELFER